MNILVLGNCTEDFYNYLKASKFFDKMYLAGNTVVDNIPNIDFEDENELASKIKALQIDVVLVTDKIFIQNGYVDFLESHYINIISPNKKWFNLEKSRLISKQLLNHYSINIPQIIRAPKDFPLVIRTDNPIKDKIVNSIDELVDALKEFAGEKTFLEEYLDGDCYEQLSLWDGKTALHFIDKEGLTEVQLDRLELLQTKLNFLLSDENPDFIGFFSTRIIWAKNDWYVLDFSMFFSENLAIKLIKTDLLYLLNSTIYQKLNEIQN